MDKCLLVGIMLVALSLMPALADAQELTIYTEEFPPYNFTENGKVTGVSTEVVKQMMAAAGFEATITSLPWDQAYQLAQEKPNTFIYSISRRQNREKLFKWIGILTPTTYSALTLRNRDDIKINSLQDMANYKIGTTKDDVVETWLLGKGFALKDFIRMSGSNAAVKNYKNLLGKRIDIWPFPDAVAYHIVRKHGHANPELLLNKSFAIEELSGGFYIAASLSTSDAVIKRAESALRNLKRKDSYYKILAHWGIDASGLKTTDPIAKLIYSLKYFERITKVGYLASDKISAHREAGLYRKEMREEFIEVYVSNFNQWRTKFIELQEQVDVLIIGTIEDLDKWDASAAKIIAAENSTIPTGTMVDGMANFAFISFENGAMAINRTIAKQIGITIPKSYLRAASRIID